MMLSPIDSPVERNILYVPAISGREILGALYLPIRHASGIFAISMTVVQDLQLLFTSLRQYVSTAEVSFPKIFQKLSSTCLYRRVMQRRLIQKLSHCLSLLLRIPMMD